MSENYILIASEQVDDFSNDDLFNISSWGADINLREIVTSYNEGDIVKPELQRKYWKSPARVTPEAQVPLTPESNLRMTPVKS